MIVLEHWFLHTCINIHVHKRLELLTICLPIWVMYFLTKSNAKVRPTAECTVCLRTDFFVHLILLPHCFWNRPFETSMYMYKGFRLHLWLDVTLSYFLSLSNQRQYSSISARWRVQLLLSDSYIFRTFCLLCVEESPLKTNIDTFQNMHWAYRNYHFPDTSFHNHSAYMNWSKKSSVDESDCMHRFPLARRLAD